ncbi:MAG: UDP-3-O-acyl-N-acetylglucosamine deacetylase, partial [Alphaproteobacteria bacterium]|nr:UDP-3-O-acyl-N-acetylglucosamine deacetylase [Alphaproteobacteria bacterium]
AALFLCGIDSATVEINGPEMPILDGSANEFINIISQVKKPGVVSRKIIVKKEVIAYRREVVRALPLLNRIYLFLHNLKTGRKEDGWVKLSPNKDGLLIKATLDYPDKIIGVQSATYLYDGSKKSFDKFIKDISKSRTFGRIWEWEYMKKKGMGRGATGENLIAINEDGTDTFNNIFNRAGPEKDAALEKYGHLLPSDMKMIPLHSKDEFVRHKIIDAIGDIFTSGGFVHGTLESYKGSHGLNNLVLCKLFSDPDNYEIVE